MALFWVEQNSNTSKTYDDLISDLNSLSKIKRNIFSNSNYSVLLNIIAGLVTSNDVVLLDKDFSQTEMENLGINNADLSVEIPVNINIRNIEELFQKLYSNKASGITLFTSGTTGRPKKVTHYFNNLTRNVRTGDKFKDNVWAFAYNLTHFAGLQVFFQAFLNINPMIYVFESSPSEIINLIEAYRITNISATPSFYRMILPLINEDAAKTNSIKKVTMGGEKYDVKLSEIIKQKFPEAKITNIYASTEAGSLFSSGNEIFSIEDPSLIQISDKNELLINKKLLGESESFTMHNDWYNTGDVVERLSSTTFRFVAREKDFINIGGYKINPLEIEDKIKEMDFIADVKVLSRNNSLLGNVLVANIVLIADKEQKEAKKEINDYLKGSLQKWKIPSVYNFTDKLALTRTGKKVLL